MTQVLIEMAGVAAAKRGAEARHVARIRRSTRICLSAIMSPRASRLALEHARDASAQLAGCIAGVSPASTRAFPAPYRRPAPACFGLCLDQVARADPVASAAARLRTVRQLHPGSDGSGPAGRSSSRPSPSSIESDGRHHRGRCPLLAALLPSTKRSISRSPPAASIRPRRGSLSGHLPGSSHALPAPQLRGAGAARCRPRSSALGHVVSGPTVRSRAPRPASLRARSPLRSKVIISASASVVRPAQTQCRPTRAACRVLGRHFQLHLFGTPRSESSRSAVTRVVARARSISVSKVSMPRSSEGCSLERRQPVSLPSCHVGGRRRA